MLNKIIDEIVKIQKEHIIVAIDGRCGAGKTTLAAQLADLLDCNLIHMDDFFLRPQQRTEERLSVPGENIDHERFLKEVLIPLTSGNTFSYKPFSCKSQKLGEPVSVTHKPVTIVEGSYSCHPRLCDYYDLRIFMDISYSEQIKRISARNGEAGLQVFKDKWIPLEEKYFERYLVKENADIVHS